MRVFAVKNRDDSVVITRVFDDSVSILDEINKWPDPSAAEFAQEIPVAAIPAIRSSRSNMLSVDRRSFICATLGSLVSCGAEPAFVTKSVGDETYVERVNGTPRALIVHVHAWSSNYQEVTTWPDLKKLGQVALVGPHFGGPNNYPQAAGHPAQLERINRVIVQAKKDYPTITKVILMGYSGGGYVSLMYMAAYPDVVSAASLHIFPHDLSAWWTENTGKRSDLEACMGGTPAQVPAQYASRSPKSVIGAITDKKIIINTSPQDTEVLPHHPIDAYNQLKASNDVVLKSFDGGHVFQPLMALDQVNSLK